jgi:peptide/nickel transport system permease protein
VVPYLARRVAVALVSLFGASVAVFAVLNVLPGSPAQVILGTQATPKAVRQLSAQLGTNKPLWVQYLHWAHGLLVGQLGQSYVSHEPIGPLIVQAFSVTGPLILFALVVGALVALPLGLGGALHNGKVTGTFLGALSQVGIAVPTFVGGILLIIVFAVKIPLFPSSGFPGWSQPLQALRSLVLPAVTLGLVEGAILSRYVRAAVLDQLHSDYLRTARSKGLTRAQALWRHGLRNAMVPLVTVLGLELAALIVGAIIVENVFSLPGVGQLLLSAVGDRDLLVVQDIVILLAAVVLVVNLLVDISYRLLDPRVQDEGAR